MKKKKGNKFVILLVVLLIILILLAAGLACGYVIFRYVYNKSNYISDSSVKIDYDYLNNEEETTVAFDDKEELDRYDVEMNRVLDNVSQDEELSGIYSLLLIGTDVRPGDNSYGNSDSMILATINSNTKKIYLVSFMRDLYANIEGVGVRKLNSAHAIGGGPLLVSTMESNYGVSIDNYVTVNFNSMIELIDLFGGVDVDLSTDEAAVANQYIYDMCVEMGGISPDGYYVTGGGMTHLNGMQAVAYARIRYVGNSDYERTSRQREVLTALLSTMKNSSITTLTGAVTEMASVVTHNLSQAKILELLSQAPTFLKYEIVTDRIPYDDLYHYNGEIIIPDLEVTVNRLRAEIYAN